MEQQEESKAIEVVSRGALPTVAEMRASIQEQAARRALLVEYVKTQMDRDRHFYDPKALGMGGGDGKLRLNQDGARNLTGLYQVFAGEPVWKEALDEEGHLTVDVRLPLISHSTGEVVAWGTGLCTTRESKYAYRWVNEKYLPRGVDKNSMRSRKGQYGMSYRIPNEDLADAYHTVRQMARKRAEVAAVMELPGVTEIFAPEEEQKEDDSERKKKLADFRKWYGTVNKKVRADVLMLLFGLDEKRVSELDLETLEHHLGVIETYSERISWGSDTITQDVQDLAKERGQAANDELFGG